MKIEKVKKVGRFLAVAGVGAIINNMIKTTTTKPSGLIGKGLLWIGGLVLVGIVSDEAMKYTDKTIDEMITDGKELVANIKEAKIEVEKDGKA